MSTTAEPGLSGVDAVDAAATPDVPSPTPSSVKSGLKANPLTDEMTRAHEAMEKAMAEMEPDSDNNPPDPEKEESALDAVRQESDRMRQMMMHQQAMGKDRLACPVLEEAIKAFVKLIKDLLHMLTFNKFKKGDPSGPGESPRMISKRNDTLKSLEDTGGVGEDLQKDVEKANKAELDKADMENDGPSPDSPGAKAMAPK